MIELAGRLLCASEADTALVSALLPEHIALTKAEPGCLRFDVAQTSDPLVWSVFEQFRTRTDFEAHRARVKASRWGQETAHIRRDYKISDIG
jgi:quinol monooxygenase YgiN